MIIELCGLPGGGKTTLATTLNKEYGCEMVALTSRIDVVHHLVRGFFAKPRIFFAGFRWCLHHDKSFYFFWNFYCIRYAKFAKAWQHNSGCVVLDEGPLQNLLSYSNHVHDEDDIEYYRKYVHLIDKVIFISVSETDREIQIQKRDGGKTYSRTHTNAQREQCMRKNAACLRSVCGEYSGGIIVSSAEELGKVFDTID